MPKHYVSRKTRCPLYKHENPQMVYCYGVTEESTIHLAFTDRSFAHEYKKRRCRGDYSRCMIYQMLTQEEIKR